MNTVHICQAFYLMPATIRSPYQKRSRSRSRSPRRLNMSTGVYSPMIIAFYISCWSLGPVLGLLVVNVSVTTVPAAPHTGDLIFYHAKMHYYTSSVFVRFITSLWYNVLGNFLFMHPAGDLLVAGPETTVQEDHLITEDILNLYMEQLLIFIGLIDEPMQCICCQSCI